MKFFILFYFIFSLCKKTKEQKEKLIEFNYDYPESNCHFLNLSSSNFDTYIQNGVNNRWLILFYTQDCRFCIQIKSMINKIIDNKRFKNDIKFGKVDLTYNTKLQVRFKITKIPYVILVKNYTMFEMKFLPTEETVTHFFESENLDEFKEFMKEFPQELSFFNFVSDLVNISLTDGAKRINEFLEKKNINFRFTPKSLFAISMGVGVPLAIILYILSFNILLAKFNKNMEINNITEKKENKENTENNKNINDNKKIKNE